MARLMPFGRRLALPSTRQIRHEPILLGIEEDRLKDLETKSLDEKAVAVPVVG